MRTTQCAGETCEQLNVQEKCVDQFYRDRSARQKRNLWYTQYPITCGYDFVIAFYYHSFTRPMSILQSISTSGSKFYTVQQSKMKRIPPTSKSAGDCSCFILPSQCAKHHDSTMPRIRSVGARCHVRVKSFTFAHALTPSVNAPANRLFPQKRFFKV